LSWKMMTSEEGKGLLVQARSANGAIRHLKAINEGDEKEGFLFAGQSVGGIHDIPTCKEVIERVIEEAERKLKEVGKNVSA
jgi:NAD(P)H-dependent flavin oxidoreductase YrpB (nitropropane dioxygenase family)